MTAFPLVYIIILNYRNYPDTIECVRSVEKISYPNYRIVIVDNASDNESEKLLRETFPGHTVVQAGCNKGYASGNNIGIRLGQSADAEFFLILNNDTVVEPDFLSILVSYALDHPNAGLLSPLIVHSTGEINRICARRRPGLLEIFWYMGIGRWFGTYRAWLHRIRYEQDYSFETAGEVEIISGSCMLLRASLIDEIGLLDENTFLYWEEFILHEKTRPTSFKTVLVPESRIVHKEGESVKTIGTRAALAELNSLNYYLRRYRGVGLVRRAAMMLSATTYFLPGMLLDLFGLRKLKARSRCLFW